MDTILIIEDDEGLSRGICFTLTKENYHMIEAATLSQGRQVLRTNQPDLILLDVNLPDGDGFAFCKEIREEYSIPIIMLTARDLETDQIIGLTVGADDYITKPFSLSVLKARIAAQLRRYHLLQEGESRMKQQWLTSANIRLCKDNCKVFRNEEEVDLSVTEYRLLKLFLEHRGQILLKEQILEAVWDTEGNFVDENTLPVNIRRLRKKLEDDPSRPKLIKTVHGMGYIWTEGAVRDED
jgi:DNA-binding response OmpR family regulator